MTDLTEKQRALLELRREIRLLSRAEADLVTELKAECNHPASHVEDYHWEHDNGYGHQRRITGKSCKLCRARKYYTLGGNWTHE